MSASSSMKPRQKESPITPSRAANALNISSYATFRFAGRQYWNSWQTPQLVVTYGVP